MKRLIVLLLAAAMLLPCLGCGSQSAPDGPVTATFFKGGKADAAVIQSGDTVILIDTGLKKNGDELVESLRALGVERISILIVTHFDRDHVGGAAEILGSFPVGTVYQSNYPKDSEEYEDYVAALQDAGITPVTVTNTVKLDLDGLKLVIDGAAQSLYTTDPSNNSSLITTVTCGATSLLFAGDALDTRLSEFLSGYTRPKGTVILKVPYHGHWQKSLPDFLTAVRPDTAVIPCSKSEPDEDELAQTVSLLESLGAEVLLTRDGDITLTIQ